MIDDQKESKFIWGVICVVVAVAIFLLAGCAGTAKYSIEHKDTKLTVFNTKDIGELKAEARYNPETKEFEIILDEKSVSASGPQAQQNELIKALLPAVVK